MRVLSLALLLGMVQVVAAQGLPLPPSARTQQDTSLSEVLARWAPDIYQDVDDSQPASDLLTSLDFDGDLDMTNNWESLEGRSFNELLKQGAVYTWGTRTATHDFLGYGFFHPRDWHDKQRQIVRIGRKLLGKGTGEHENDFEGILLVIDRATDEPVLMVTQAHNDFWQYGDGDDWRERSLVSGRYRNKKREDLDGPIRRDPVTGRVQVFLEAQGHGAYGSPSKTNFDGERGDGVLYTEAGSKLTKQRDDAHVTGYRLESILPWWERFDRVPVGESNSTFTRENGKVAFSGDTKDDDAANPPWGWRDGDYPDAVNGLFFSAPEEFVNWMFQPTDSYSRRTVERTFPLDPGKGFRPRRPGARRPGATGVLRRRQR